MKKEFSDIGADIRTLPHPTEAREASTIIRALSRPQKKSKILEHPCSKHSLNQLHYIHNEQLKTQK